MARLSPADEEFFNRVSENVTESNALPFDIPIDRLPKIVLKAAKYFWEMYPDATYERSLYVPGSELAKKDINGNGMIQLPNGIEGIIQVFTTGSYAGTTLKDALRIPLLNSYGSTFSTQSSGGTSGYGAGVVQPSDGIMAMMEYDMLNSTFRKTVQFSFNRHSSILNVLGQGYGTGLVLHCYVRLPMEYLYADRLFEDYVTAMVMESLGKIVMSFDFTLPGGVKINYDQIRSDGTDRRKEIEEEMKGMQGVPIIFYR